MRISALLALWLLLSLAVAPTGDFSLYDDWVYSWAARSFHSGRGLDIVEWSAAVPLFQVLWGALFLHLGSGEFVLRLATLAAALAGNICWYAFLRRRGLERGDATFSVALLLFNPVYFLLSLTFMTDVFFLSLCQIFFYLAARWREKPSWPAAALWILALLAAGFTRQLGVALAAAVAAAALASRRRGLAWAALVAVAVIGTGQWAFVGHTGGGLPLGQRFSALASIFSVSPGLYAEGLVVAAAFVGLALAPAALRAPAVSLARVLSWAWLLAAAWLLCAESPVLRDGAVWGACELGGARSLLSGRPQACGWAWAARGTALVLASVGLANLAAVLAGRTRELSRRPLFSILRPAAFSAAPTVFASGLTATALCLSAAMLVLWMFADRYWLPVAAMAAPLLLASAAGRRPESGGIVARAALEKARPLMAWALVACFATVSVAGSFDAFGFYRDLNALARESRNEVEPNGSLDAGYAVNARVGYLGRPRAAAGQGRNSDVPWVSAVAAAELTIANRVEPGWEELRASRGLFVVRKKGGNSDRALYSSGLGRGGRSQ